MASSRDLRAAVEAAVRADVERVGGVAAFHSSVVVAAFEGRGARRATLFRWVERHVQSGAPTVAFGVTQATQLGDHVVDDGARIVGFGG